jgi:hypothetical protein
VSGATGYYLYVATSGGSSVHGSFYGSSVCSGGICQVTPNVNLSAGSYAWKVAAYNAAGYGPYSSVTSFTVGGTPAAPTGLTTQGNLNTAPAAPTYRWNAVSGASGYYLYVATSGGSSVHGSFYDSSVCSGGICQVTPSVSLQAGNYAWKVAAYNVAGYGPYSSVVSFTLGSGGLSVSGVTATVSLMPTNAPTVTPTHPLIATLVPTEMPTMTAISTETPTNTSLPPTTPILTDVPTSTAVPTQSPTATDIPTSTVAPTEPPNALPTVLPTSTPVPTEALVETVTPTG